MCSLTKPTVIGWGARKPSGLGSSQLSHGGCNPPHFRRQTSGYRGCGPCLILRSFAVLPVAPRELWGPAWLPGSPGSPGLPSRASSSPRLGVRNGTLLASSSRDPAQGQLRAGAPTNGNWTTTHATPISRDRHGVVACGLHPIGLKDRDWGPLLLEPVLSLRKMRGT